MQAKLKLDSFCQRLAIFTQTQQPC